MAMIMSSLWKCSCGLKTRPDIVQDFGLETAAVDKEVMFRIKRAGHKKTTGRRKRPFHDNKGHTLKTSEHQNDFADTQEESLDTTKASLADKEVTRDSFHEEANSDYTGSGVEKFFCRVCGVFIKEERYHYGGKLKLYILIL